MNSVSFKWLFHALRLSASLVIMWFGFCCFLWYGSKYKTACAMHPKVCKTEFDVCVFSTSLPSSIWSTNELYGCHSWSKERNILLGSTYCHRTQWGDHWLLPLLFSSDWCEPHHHAVHTSRHLHIARVHTCHHVQLLHLCHQQSGRWTRDIHDCNYSRRW